MALLDVRDLSMYYGTLRGDVRAVDGISLKLEKGRALGLVGESGSGKSSLASTLLRLLPQNGRIVSGQVKFGGVDILGMPEEDFRRQIRWKKISMIFQGAMNALNPVHKIGYQISEAIITHEGVSRRDALRRARELLEMVGINAARVNSYPHELSGGMKQRVVIAMALACNPDLVIADEPTTALDVMVQLQVLAAISELRRRLSLSMILITHDLAVVANTCDSIAIMYAGKVVEFGSIEDVFASPLHPYTCGLMGASPEIRAERSRVRSIPGVPPNLLDPPSGCRFHPRCGLAEERCKLSEPGLVTIDGKGHSAACFLVSSPEKGDGV